jgi:hypothetical protein
MKDYKLLFVLGLIVLFFPFLGIPEFFRNFVIAVVGVFLIGYAIYLRSIFKSKEVKKSHEVYVESDISEITVNEEILEEGESFEDEINKKENE